MSNSNELKVKYHGNKDKPTRKKNPNVADISRQGYRDDSPYRSMPYIDIYAPSGSIDMSGTGIPLWANGRILPPYSGIHQFDTTQVKEIPLAQYGREMPFGMPLKEVNPFTVAEYRQPMMGNFILPDPNRPELMNTRANEYKIGIGTDEGELQIPTIVSGQYIGPDNAVERAFRAREAFLPMADPSSYSKFYEMINQLGIMKQKKGGSLPIPKKQKGGWLKQYQSNKEAGEVLGIDPKTGLPVKNLEGVEITGKPLNKTINLPAVEITAEAKKPWYDKLFIPKPLKRIKENLAALNTSYGYDMSPVDVFRQAVGLNKNDKSMNFEKYPEFDIPTLTEHDAWRMYLGLPQEYHSFEPSQYEKGAYQIKGYSDSFPEKWPSEEEIKKGLDYEFFKNAKTSGDRKASLKPWGDFVMGRHRVTPGSDDRGKYLEYYDEWDLDSYKYNNIPVGKAFDKLMGNPFKIRGRVYYAKDPETGEYIIQRKQGGSKLPPHLPEAYKAGGSWTNQYQTGGATVRQIWEATTGKKWADAKKEGLTDGSYESNKALEKKLRAGDFGKLVVPKVVQPQPPIQAAGPARLSDQGYTVSAFRPAAGRTVTQARQDIADRERAEQENASRMLYMGALNKANNQVGARDATANSKIKTQKEIKQRLETPITADRDDTKLAPEGSVRSYLQKAVNFMDFASKVSKVPGSEIGTSFITAPLQSGLNISNTVMGDRPIRSDADIGSLAWDVATVAPYVSQAAPFVKQGVTYVPRKLAYLGVDPVNYNVPQKIKEFVPTLYKSVTDPAGRAVRVGKKYEQVVGPLHHKTSERMGKNLLDSWSVGLGFGQKYNTLTPTGEGLFRITNFRQDPDLFKSLMREINLSKRNSPNQLNVVEKARDPNFKYSVYDVDEANALMGNYRWDVAKTPEGNWHFRSDDFFDLHPFKKSASVYKGESGVRKKGLLDDFEALSAIGGKPFRVQNNFIVDPKTFQVIKRFNEGGNMKKSWLDKYQGDEGKSQTGKLWLNPITGQYVQQGIETSASPLDLVGGIGNIPGLLRGTGAMVMNLLNKPHRQVVTSTRDSALMGYGYEDPKMSYPSRPSGPVPAFYPWPKSYQVGGESEESEGPVMKPRMGSVEAGKDIPEVTVTQETENFGDAFKRARSSGLKTFTWRGKLYTTQYKSEVEKKKAPASTAPKQQPKKTEAKPQPKPQPQVKPKFPLSIELQRSQYPQAKTSVKPKVAAQPARTAPQQGGYSVVVTDPQGSRVTSRVAAAPKVTPVVSAPAPKPKPAPKVTGTTMNIPAINYGYNIAPASTTAVVTGTVRGTTLPAKTQKPQAAKLQNQQPQNVAADMKDQQTNMMGNTLSQLNQKDQRQLPQTGVIVDKRTGQAYVKTGSDIYDYPVLTGHNVEGNITGGSPPDDLTFSFKSTPRGYYTLQDKRMIDGKLYPIDASDYEGGLARWMVPINAFGMPASDAVYNAMHGTYLGDYANRNPRYNQPSDKRWISYGCVNARECDLKKTFNDIAVGDTSLVLDSKYPQDAALLQMIQNQQAAIRRPLVANTKVKKTGGDVKNWLEKYK